MKFIIAVLAVTAVLAQETPDHTLEIMDDFLETESSMSLPCIPKTCMPVCKLVTKYVTYGAYKLPYQENVCAPDTKCLAEKAACIAKLNAAMKAAEAAEKDMIAKSKLANAAKATKAQKDAAAAAKKKEEAAASDALAAAKAAFEVAEKEAAAANAASVSAASSSKNKNADMAKALAKYEATKKMHLEAQAAYAGAKSAAGKAHADYVAALKAHCDAEAKHAEAVKYIGHPQHEVTTCRDGQGKAPSAAGACPKVTTIAHGSCKKEHVDLDGCIGNAGKQTAAKKRSDDHKYVHPFVPAGKKTCVCSYARCGSSSFRNFSQGATVEGGKCICSRWTKGNHNYVWKIVVDGKTYKSSEANALARGTKVCCNK
jgi:hypothetical protein